MPSSGWLHRLVRSVAESSMSLFLGCLICGVNRSCLHPKRVVWSLPQARSISAISEVVGESGRITCAPPTNRTICGDEKPVRVLYSCLQQRGDLLLCHRRLAPLCSRQVRRKMLDSVLKLNGFPCAEIGKQLQSMVLKPTTIIELAVRRERLRKRYGSAIST